MNLVTQSWDTSPFGSNGVTVNGNAGWVGDNNCQTTTAFSYTSPCGVGDSSGSGTRVFYGTIAGNRDVEVQSNVMQQGSGSGFGGLFARMSNTHTSIDGPGYFIFLAAQTSVLQVFYFDGSGNATQIGSNVS